MAGEWFKHLGKRLRDGDEVYNPLPDAGWQAMESKLDEAFGKEKKRRRGLWWWLIMPFLVAGGAGIYYQSGVLKNEKSVSNAHLKNIVSKNKNPVHNTNFSQVQEQQKLSAPTKQPVLISAEADQEKSSVSVTHSIAVRRSIGEKENLVLSINNNLRRTKAGKKKAAVDQPESRVAEANLSQKQTTRANQEFSSATTEKKIAEEKDVKEVSDTALQQQPVTNDGAKAKPVQKKNTVGRRLFARFIAGSSVNSVRFSNADPAGLQAGLGLGYQVNKSWQVGAALMVARVRYAAGPGDYKVYRNLYGGQLKSIDANCLILELPVTVAYTFYRHKKWSTSVWGSASAQFMNSEDYQYRIVRNGNPYLGVWKYSNDNQHFFSAASVGFGVGYRPHKKMTVQLQPFFRAPLSGIGAGDVKLKGAGVLLEAQFFPFMQKNKEQRQPAL